MRKIIALSFLSLIALTAAANGPNKEGSKKSTMKIRKRSARPDIPGNLLIEFGFNALQNDDPSIDTKLIGNRTVNFYYLYDIRVGKTNFFVLPGIGLGLDRYKFDEDVTLVQDPFAGLTGFSDIIGGGVKKSMLVTNYIDIPIEVRYLTNPADARRSFKAGVGFKVGYLYSAHTKIKQELEGEMFKTKVKGTYNLNRFRYGVTGRIGIGGFNVFYYQSLNPLFEDGEGPFETEANNITKGLSFTGF